MLQLYNWKRLKTLTASWLLTVFVVIKSRPTAYITPDSFANFLRTLLLSTLFSSMIVICDTFMPFSEMKERKYCRFSSDAYKPPTIFMRQRNRTGWCVYNTVLKALNESTFLSKETPKWNAYLRLQHDEAIANEDQP